MKTKEYLVSYDKNSKIKNISQGIENTFITEEFCCNFLQVDGFASKTFRGFVIYHNNAISKSHKIFLNLWSINTEILDNTVCGLIYRDLMYKNNRK